MHVELTPRAEPHLDPAAHWIPSRHVGEVVEVQALGIQLSPQHLNQVAIERGGDAGAVVVGRDEARW